LLLEHGYKALTIRSVASECGIAPGTVYNYFPSKDMLCAVIMLEDWNKALSEGAMLSGNSKDCITGLEHLFNSIQAFTEIYRSVWSESGTGAYITGEYHLRLVGSIRAAVLSLLERTGSLGNPDQSAFLSEILIHSATRSDVDFSDIKPFIMKLI